MHKDIFNGSLQVTTAKDPARFYRIKLIPHLIKLPLLILSSSVSHEKSLSPISLVVIIAIVTDLDITGDIISLMAFSRAFETILVKSISSVIYYCKDFISI